MADPKITTAGNHAADRTEANAPRQHLKTTRETGGADSAPGQNRPESSHAAPKSERRASGEHQSMKLGDLARQREHVLKHLQHQPGNKPDERAPAHGQDKAAQRANHGADDSRRPDGQLKDHPHKDHPRSNRTQGDDQRRADNPRGRQAEEGRRHESRHDERAGEKDKADSSRSHNSGPGHLSREDSEQVNRRRNHQSQSREGESVGDGVRHRHGGHDGDDSRARYTRAERGGRGESGRTIVDGILEHLRGEGGRGKGREKLTTETLRSLDAVFQVVGRGEVGKLIDKHGDRLEKYVAHLFGQTERGFERAERAGNLVSREAGQKLGELADTLKLLKHFDHLEKTGGETVRRAGNAALSYLTHELEHHAGANQTRPQAELLRDLRAGAFLPAHEMHNPFPLTGRARVVSEMMELMRTLDAVERFMQRGDINSARSESNGAGTGAVLAGGGNVVGAADLPLEGLLLALFPMLPGRAARMELARLIAALNGPLMDAGGQTLTTADGIQLKPDQLLWLSAAGGILKSSFDVQQFAARMSPLLVYGFDAIFSLIGFDGRTLAAPHYAAVQAQVNASELDWVFGHPPLTEGWTRALIEQLKDAPVPAHNLLGEMLEEAMLDGRFHTVLLQGAVEEGEAVRDSFSVTRLIPGSSAAAFATA